jgi:predicted nucleic acid-binding protein
VKRRRALLEQPDRGIAGAELIADGLIVATAIHHNRTIVTRNVRDFAGLAVPILNPWEL